MTSTFRTPLPARCPPGGAATSPRHGAGRAAMTTASTALVSAVAALLVGCGGGGDDGPRTIEGTPQPLGQGTARSWVRLNAQGTPQAVGVTLSEAALQGLPTTPVEGPAAAELVLKLPAEAAATGIDHIEVEWNPQGHDPNPIYGVAHFDVHFYLISQAQQQAILPSDPAFATKAARLPSSAYVPAGYVLPGDPVANTVPQMGAHWIDPRSPEFNGQPFTSTFLFGSYDGRFTFVEPMVSKAFLDTKPNVVHDVPQPGKVAIAGFYPSRYRVSYDATAKAYQIVLDGLVRRDAS